MTEYLSSSADPLIGDNDEEDHIMLKVEQAAGQVIANDTQQSVQAVDHAVVSLANLCASIVEVSRASKLPITTAQSALNNAGESLNRIIETRATVGKATRDLLKLKKQSSLDTVAVGCPPEYELTGQEVYPVTAKESI